MDKAQVKERPPLSFSPFTREPVPPAAISRHMGADKDGSSSPCDMEGNGKCELLRGAPGQR